MDTGLTVMEGVAHLANLYPSWKYGVTVLETNARTREFHPMDRQLDKPHLTMFCPGSQYVPLAIDSRRVYGLYDSGSNVTIISHGLARALGLQVLPFNGTFLQAAGHLGRFVGRLRPILFSCMIGCNLK